MKDGKVVDPAEEDRESGDFYCPVQDPNNENIALQVINDPEVEDKNKMLFIEPTDSNVSVITEEEAQGVDLIEYIIDNLLVEIVVSKGN